ncbi:MAG: hypothetical protein ABEH38_03575 [Flavobacteriales bacterium]
MDEYELQLPEGVLIADAGGTKVDWAIGGAEGVTHLRTQGIHPYFQDAASVRSTLKAEEASFGIDPHGIQRIHFYGAGCSSAVRKRRIEDGLRGVFPNASIEVEHDLLGAARAVSANEPGFLAILGTGSNACSFDGSRIVEQSGGLGYILGDEGSGAHLGKLLLRELLNGDLPRELEEKFRKAYAVDRDRMIDQIHRGEAPSRYLAGFAPFLKEHEEHEHIKELIEGSFREFIERHVLRFKGSKGGVLHTVGSIGLHFRSCLERVLEEMGSKPGRSIADQEVIKGLVEYHHTGSER